MGTIFQSVTRERGYHLAGDELMIRYALFRTILEDVTSKDDDFIYRYFIHERTNTIGG